MMDIGGMPLTLLVNPHSAGGRALKLLPRVEAVLDSNRAQFRVERTKSLEHGVEAALRAVDAAEVPVVMSGDGLLGAVGGAMAGSETPLGLIPSGRGNDLARVLEIPTEPEAAAEVLLGGRSRRIDVGEANGKRFLGIASTGFDSVCNELANRTRLPLGSFVYAYSAFVTLVRWKPARFTVRAGSEQKRLSGYSIAVANNKAFGGGMFVAPDAELDDGEFDIVHIGEISKWHYASNLPKVFKGTHVEDERVSVFRASQLELSASRPFALYADGEHLTDLPASLRVLPRALSVLVPAPPEA
jgi:YegS/Rv2252/BmrU family lipid kinase